MSREMRAYIVRAGDLISLKIEGYRVNDPFANGKAKDSTLGSTSNSL